MSGDALTKAFFADELQGLKESFAAETGADKVIVDLMLRSGQTVRLEGEPVCTDSYIAFDRKDGSHKSRTVLLYKSILGVHLSAENEKRVGFR